MTKPKANKPATSRSTGDTRLKRDSAPEVRGSRGVQDGAERTNDTGLLSEDELEQFIRDEFEQTALPSPPALPGMHLCWLTTTSGYDTLQKRQRIGYKPVRSDELPGFDPSNGQALANFEGYVTCNEMILCKIPERVYQSIMNLFHHKMPLEEENSVVEQTKKVTAHESQQSKKELLTKEMGDGTSELEQSVEHGRRLTPMFS